jgi:putative Holliday junction resolvase
VRAAGIDVGKVRVGVAVADELGLMAHPRDHLDGRDPRRVIDALAELAAAEKVEVFVVGLPRSLRGEEGPAARRARRFARKLGERTGLRIELYDEWLSTREARSRLREQGVDDRSARERIDSAAAAVVLQSWLDGKRAGRP